MQVRSTILSVALALAPLTALADDAAPVLELDGKTVRVSDLPPDVRNSVHDAQQEAYEKSANELRQLAVRIALAKEKDPKADLKKLPQLDQLLAKKPPTEKEIAAFFEDNKGRLPPGATIDQFKADIIRFLEEQSVRKQYTDKLAELEKGKRFRLVAAAPVAPVTELDLSAFPTLGPKDAKVTLVEASDYTCPHCQQEHADVKALLKDYGSKIRFVQINFALRPQQLSGALIRGAYCARKQSDDGFWKFHDKAFEKKLTDGDGAVAQASAKVAEVAKEAGLDVKKIESCFDGDEAKKFVDATVAQLEAAGVSGTPTFFLNGRKVSAHHGDELRQQVAAALGEKADTH